MKIDDCYQLGEVVKTHGIKGEVSVLLDVDFPKEYEELESVFLLQNDQLVPFFIETLQINHKRALVKFEDVDSIEDSAKLVKTEIYLPLSFLPKLPNGGYYFHDLVGCEVREGNEILGTVNEIIDFNGNELLSVGSKKILIPMKDKIMLKVDTKEKTINVKLPDGLLDIYA
ncbi:MAG: ribosome maturation factor RimM [Bacteroidota bacterium]